MILVAQFTADGVATDPTLPLVLTITGTAYSLEVTELEHPEPGIFTYDWTPPAVSVATDFLVTWNPGGDDISAVETVTVQPQAAGMWATLDDVTAVTGKTVTLETLAVASSIISTFAGADVEMPADSITAVDRRHLRRATAWQAVWSAAKPGLTTDRENATTVTSDTQSITRADRADSLLAPLARRELASLSWVGTRSAIVRGPRESARPSFLNEASDGYGTWKALDV